jgi:aryl-alcohol dehydrogenase-like predicted oxidoreductase
MQNHYDLVYREEEPEMLPLCEGEGVGVVLWSPLGRGYLARPHEAVDATTRGASDSDQERLYEHPYRDGGGPGINERVEEPAAEKGVSMAQIALA